MKKKNIINSILQNTRMPEGFFGRIILRGMNKGHASLSRWGLSQIEWKSTGRYSISGAEVERI